MTLRTSAGQGRYVASEWDVFMAIPEAWANPSAYPGILRPGGAGATAFTISTLDEFSRTLAERFPLLAIDAGGTATWGNDTCITRMGQAKTYLQDTRGAKAGKVFIATGSMGFLTALNYARANLSSVAAVAGTVPCLDLTDIHANNRGGFAAEINTAYGGTYVPGTHEATHSPLAFAASLTIPIFYYYGTDDTVCMPAASTAFAAAAPNVTALGVGGGHGAGALQVPTGYLDRILDFFAKYAP